jgi:solute carrier family 35 protein F1/2
MAALHLSTLSRTYKYETRKMPGNVDVSGDNDENRGPMSLSQPSSLMENDLQALVEGSNVNSRSRNGGGQHDCGVVAVVLPSLKGFWLAVRERRLRSSGNGKKIRPRSRLAAVALGQAIALAAAAANAVSYSLANTYGLQIQFLQLVPVYMLLSLHLICRREHVIDDGTSAGHEIPPGLHGGAAALEVPGTRIRLRVPWHVYGLVSVLDVIPNLLQLLSFRYTSLTSTTLLGSLTVPSTMLFSYLLLAKRFLPVHYAGACLCVVGGIVAGWSDAGAPKLITKTNATFVTSAASPVAAATFAFDEGETEPLGRWRGWTSSEEALAGDALAFVAAVLYGLGDAVGEYAVKYIDRREYLGMLGLFGTILSGTAVPLLERSGVEQLRSERCREIFPLLVLYVACVVFYYVAAARFYSSSDATLLNLCLLASNLWVLGLSALFAGGFPWAAAGGPASPPLYAAALLLTVTGVALYQRPRDDEDGPNGEREGENGEADFLMESTLQERSQPVSGYQSL